MNEPKISKEDANNLRENIKYFAEDFGPQTKEITKEPISKYFPPHWEHMDYYERTRWIEWYEKACKNLEYCGIYTRFKDLETFSVSSVEMSVRKEIDTEFRPVIQKELNESYKTLLKETKERVMKEYDLSPEDRAHIHRKENLKKQKENIKKQEEYNRFIPVQEEVYRRDNSYVDTQQQHPHEDKDFTGIIVVILIFVFATVCVLVYGSTQCAPPSAF